MENLNNSVKSPKNYGAYRKELLLFVILVMTIFFIASLFIPTTYKSNASILITQKDSSGMDAYKEVKSAEFTGKIVGQIMLSNTFMEGVMDSNEAAKTYFGGEPNPEKKLKKWQDSINIDQVSSTGVLNISMYSPNKVDARNILVSMIDLLKKNGQDYFGNPQIGIKTVNKPYYIDSPSSPNFLLNIAVGAVLGIGLIILATQILGEKFYLFLVRLFGHKN